MVLNSGQYCFCVKRQHYLGPGVVTVTVVVLVDVATVVVTVDEAVSVSVIVDVDPVGSVFVVVVVIVDTPEVAVTTVDPEIAVAVTVEKTVVVGFGPRFRTSEQSLLAIGPYSEDVRFPDIRSNCKTLTTEDGGDELVCSVTTCGSSLFYCFDCEGIDRSGQSQPSKERTSHYVEGEVEEACARATSSLING